MIRVALDSNVLVYGAGISRGPDDAAKIDFIKRLNQRLCLEAQTFVSTQALGETFNVVVKAGFDRTVAQETILQYLVLFAPITPSLDDLTTAAELAATHKLQIWDALILACTHSARASILLSEDMQDGFTWRGVTVLNPLSERAEQLLFG